MPWQLWVILLGGLYLLALLAAQCWVWVRTARDGEPPRWIVEASEVIGRTPEETFALVGDPRNDPRRDPRVLDVDFDGGGGPAAGAHYRQRVRFGGATGTFACAIVAYDPPRTIEIRCQFGRRPLFGGYRLAPHSDGCLLTVRSGTTYTAAGLLAAPVSRWLTRRACREDLARIRATLEGRADMT